MKTRIREYRHKIVLWALIKLINIVNTDDQKAWSLEFGNQLNKIKSNKLKQVFRPFLPYSNREVIAEGTWRPYPFQ